MDHCETTGPGCVTCGDVAVPLTVLTVEGVEACCVASDGRQEQVVVELLGDCRPGDVVLVHAGVAIGKVG
jgi:hydrogenase expression/formation protein HypC